MQFHTTPESILRPKSSVRPVSDGGLSRHAETVWVENMLETSILQLHYRISLQNR